MREARPTKAVWGPSKVLVLAILADVLLQTTDQSTGLTKAPIREQRRLFSISRNLHQLAVNFAVIIFFVIVSI